MHPVIIIIAIIMMIYLGALAAVLAFTDLLS